MPSVQGAASRIFRFHPDRLKHLVLQTAPPEDVIFRISEQNKTHALVLLCYLQFVCSLFELFCSCTPSSRPPVCAFVDNRYAIDAANNTNKCKANRKQVAETRRAVSALRTLTEVSIRWVPAHAGVGGNEVADSLAKRGGKGTTSRAPLPRRPRLLAAPLTPLSLPPAPSSTQISS